MTILEALRQTTESIRNWAEAKFLNKNDAVPIVHIAGSDTVVWTGNEEAVDIGADKPYYYISEATPTIDDCVNGIYVNITAGEPFYFPKEDIFTDDNGSVHVYDNTVIIINNNSAGKLTEMPDGYLVFPYAGVYIEEKYVDYMISFTIPGYTGFGARQIVDPNYILHPIQSTVTMLADAWDGENTPYYQTVECSGVTANSKIDLQPTPEQVVELHNSKIALMASNNDGIVTIYSFNGKPTIDMNMDVLITDVTAL